ncbi:unnamed protein product [Rotaria sordida]|uniref:E3 ubiquitin-protein ligase PPP1R11 n=1 Tax=Rotaria sordida TaxID=392033 RepID=A0A819L303_9BILA|nr:unnamed protein product [Rotaria sordida]CAF1217480.1 unnamed protein product [Rotaria sordida]CAF1340522.1 unnamed protein product [Rotaria sordida]CAF3959328.1 unnamed protein product [Rotaria sordida]
MATSTSTVIKTQTRQVTRTNPPPSLVLELNPSNETTPRVRWTEETIDNEHLNKKKSKCCCVYTKPHDAQLNDDQTTEANEFDNCQHCRFHTESDYAAKPNERQPKIKVVVKKPE